MHTAVRKLAAEVFGKFLHAPFFISRLMGHHGDIPAAVQKVFRRFAFAGGHHDLLNVMLFGVFQNGFDRCFGIFFSCVFKTNHR